MTIIGSASIQIRADDKYFEPDVRRAVKKIKNVAIQLKADTDITKASKKIRDLRYRITSKDAVLKIDANLAKAEEKMAKFLAKFMDKDLNFNAVANTRGANSALTDLRDRFVSTRVPFTATANTAAARAALAFTARNRVSRISVLLDPVSLAAAKGLFNTLTGTLPFEKVKNVIAGVAANFEGLAVKAGLATAALGALSAVVLTAGGNLFSIAGDIVQVGGLLALLPVAILGLVAVLKTNKMAWDGFGDAAKDNSKKANEALAKLPPEAQKAALAMRGVREEIQKPVQAAFWKSVGTSLQDMVEAQLPAVITGMSRIGGAMGGFSKEVFDTVAGLTTLPAFFERTATSIDNMVGGIKPAISGLSIFTEIGSRYLPRFGEWMTELGNKFGAFAQKAADNGQIVSWINMSILRAKELGSVIASTAGIFTGLANAASLAGSSGLTEMAAGLKNISEIVNSEPFQSRLISIIEGAREGTAKFGAGLRTLTDLFSENAKSVGIFLDKTGEIAGLTFENITTMFDGTGLGTGLMDALDGLSEGLAIMEPGFRDLGGLIGDLGEIAGELFRSMAPGLNMLADTLSSVVAGLKDGILSAMPVLNEFVQSVLQLAAGPLITIAEGVGNILEVFADLPGIMQTAIASIGLFLLLKPRIDAMWTGMRTTAALSFAGLATDVDAAGTRTQTSFGRSAGAIRDSWKAVGTELSEGRMLKGYVTNMDRLSAGTLAVRDAIGTTAGQGLRMAGGGLMSALGGPWGAAIAGATVLVGLYANAQAEAKAKVDELKGSMDQQTGAFSGNSRKILASDIIDYESGKDAWSAMWRFGRKTATEAMDKIGLELDEVTKKLTDPNNGRAYGDAWREIGSIATSSIGGTLEITDELAAAVGKSRTELEGMGAQDLATLAHGIGQAAKTAQEAQDAINDLAKATGTNSIVAAQLAKNYDTLKSSTSSASDKFSALRQNLDLLSGGQKTAHVAARDYAQSLDDQKKAMSELITTHGGVVDSTGRINDAFRNTLVAADGTFSTATQGARDFSVQMDSAADSILKQGTAALDGALKAGKSMPEAMALAMEKMQPAVATLRSTLATLGFDAGQVDGIIKQLGLEDVQLTKAMSIDTTQSEIDVARLKLAATSFSDRNYTAVLAALPQGAKDAISSSMNLGDEFANGDYEAILKVFDDTPGKREAVLAALLTYDGSDWTAFLRANNLVPEAVAAANTAAEKLIPEKSTVLRAQDLATSTLAHVNTYVVGDKKIALTATDLVTNVLGTINNSPLADKNNRLTTQDLVTQMVTDVNNTQLNNKLNTLQTQDLVSGIMAEVNAKTLNGKSSTLTAQDLASIVVQGVNNLVISDKRFKITTEYLTSGNPVHGAGQVAQPLANGGMFNSSGVQSFANGGILGRLNLPKVKSYAGGGLENHTAQIAKGAWPVRIWAEPETGGEAYLPLGKNKRKRSLEILRQVMAEFGLSSFATFAGGGIMAPTSYSTPSVVSSRYANSQSAVNQTVATAGGVPASVVNFTVNPSQGLSEEQIGEAAMRELYWQITSR